MLPLAQFTQTLGNRIRFAPGILVNEVMLQDAVAESLKECGIDFTREESLNRRDRPDFLICGNTIAVEVKKGKAGMAELRQVGRYLENSAIKSVLFISTRFSERVPVLMGKPIEYVDLWKFQI